MGGTPIFEPWLHTTCALMQPRGANYGELDTWLPTAKKKSVMLPGYEWKSFSSTVYTLTGRGKPPPAPLPYGR